MRYVIEEHPSGLQVPDVYTVTIDGAIELAKKLSISKDHPVRVVLKDRAEHLVRGVARSGRWCWARLCKRCSGAKEVTLGYGATQACSGCSGQGFVEEP